MTREKTTLERNYDASLDDVWELWTTKEGIESWWGPDGFATTVRALELRAGGHAVYAMTAVGPEQVAFMKNAGMPVTTESRMTYTEVVPKKRLAFRQTVDFVPGVAPYEVETTVELEASSGSVRMVVTLDAMHDEQWTRNAVAGWESQLGKLGKKLATPKTT